MEERTPNEAVADLHKALAEGTNYGSSASGKRVALARPRSLSDVHGRPSEEAARLNAPGGFRRHYLNRQADEAGVPQEERPLAWQSSLLHKLRPLVRTGHFASVMGISMDPETGEEVSPPKGRSGDVQTLLALVKSFIGSGITFLPSAFAHGGWLLSSLFLLSIAAVTFICVWLLLECRMHTRTSSYGEIAAKAVGPGGKSIVHMSLVLGQFGVCIAFIIFVSELAVSLGMTRLSYAIGMQIIVLVPLCLIRSLDHLDVPNLVADMLILMGLGVVLSHHVTLLSYTGVDTSVVPIRSSTFGVSVGTMIYVFEGIPMILPIRNSMQEPERFFPLFAWVFVGVTCFFEVFGLLGYLCLGETARTVVLLNLPLHSTLTWSTKAAYMLALLLSLPLMFLPAARITEVWASRVVGKGGQQPAARTVLRVAQVCMLAYVACTGGPYFDKFLAMIGAFCATPIAFIYPALFHMMLCAESLLAKAIDVACMAFGFAAMAITLLFL